MELLIHPLMVESGMIADFGANINQNIRQEMNITEILLLMAGYEIFIQERNRLFSDPF